MAIYLDHASTTPLRPELIKDYLGQLQVLGNPSSVHSSGQSARRVLEDARDQLAVALDCHRSEILFTSGGTEGNNLAIKGLYLERSKTAEKPNIIISLETEHHAGIDPIDWLVDCEGAEAVWMPVSAEGEPDFVWLEQFLENDAHRVALVSAMWLNNETGLLIDVAKIAKLASSYGIPMHSDAVAAFGHVALSFKQSGLATMAVSGHKIGAPVGIGVLVVGRNTKIAVTSHGGGQERGIRSGTLSAPLAKAFADAASLAMMEIGELNTRLAAYAQQLVNVVQQIAPDAVFSRGSQVGFPGIVHFTFPGCSGDSLLFLLDSAGFSVSTGSACRAGVAQASHVLIAMGRTEEQARGSLRISLGYSTTQDEINRFIDAFPKVYESALKAGLASD